MKRTAIRCSWCGTDPLYVRYHDTEWGVPVHDDRKHFEMITLEGAQAGLSWLTVLRKREGYRKAFAGFDPRRVARYTAKDRARLLKDASIIRNKLKIESTISNASAFLKIQKTYGSFDRFIWSFVEERQIGNTPRTLAGLPAATDISDRISKELKQRGFRFVGSTIVYAYMQAAGLVDDHLVTCFRKRPRPTRARKRS